MSSEQRVKWTDLGCKITNQLTSFTLIVMLEYTENLWLNRSQKLADN